MGIKKRFTKTILLGDYEIKLLKIEITFLVSVVTPAWFKTSFYKEKCLAGNEHQMLPSEEKHN